MLSIWNFEYSSQTSKFKACILLSISAERVHASHPYRAVDMTMALRSLIYVLIEIDLLLSRLEVVISLMLMLPWLV